MGAERAERGLTPRGDPRMLLEEGSSTLILRDEEELGHREEETWRLSSWGGRSNKHSGDARGQGQGVGVGGQRPGPAGPGTGLVLTAASIQGPL